MKTILVSEKNLDLLFDKCLVDLELKKALNKEWFPLNDAIPSEVQFNNAISAMHRYFHYKVECLKSDIKKA
jgi:hypothetical protein